MSKQRRHEQILAALADAGECSVEKLGERFGVSPMTVRRDLAELVAAGRVRRTHGGAALSRAGVTQFRFAGRGECQAKEKRAIGRAAAQRVAPGMSVVLDTGTTVLEVARELRAVEGLRILTTSLPVAAELHDAPGTELILLGGRMRQGLPDLSGPLTESNLAQFQVDLAILGADSAAPEGVFTDDLSVARVNQAMLAAAEQAVLVADHTKFARRSFARYADWSQFAAIVTDGGVGSDVRAWLRNAGPHAIIVEC